MFLVISKPDDPEGHLALLAQIARVMSDESARTALMTAESAEELAERVVQRVVV